MNEVRYLFDGMQKAFLDIKNDFVLTNKILKKVDKHPEVEKAFVLALKEQDEFFAEKIRELNKFSETQIADMLKESNG